jgi:hypothetical protein
VAAGKLRNGNFDLKLEPYDEYLDLNEAIDTLITEMARIEPELVRDEAREVLSKAVRELIRSAGTVD